jgi:hypothetical protein
VWGCYQDLRAVVAMAQRGELAWDVEPMPLAAANEALVRMRNGEVAGRIVLTHEASHRAAGTALPGGRCLPRPTGRARPE